MAAPGTLRSVEELQAGSSDTWRCSSASAMPRRIGIGSSKCGASRGGPAAGAIRTRFRLVAIPATAKTAARNRPESRMTVRIATWNINSVRLREAAVLRFLREEAPDVLCLQETKAPIDKIPLEGFRALGYRHVVARGQKSYNGVAILSRLPLEDAGHRDFCIRGDARHVAARLPSGTVLHNLYVPAGGDEPDPGANPKFAHKLDFLAELRAWFTEAAPRNAILVGDLNVAPREDDVWNHKRLLRIVSHTPVEVEALAAVRDAGAWVDVTRAHVPDGRLYSWWSYRAPDWQAADKGRRLDHVWATPDLAERSGGSRIARHVRGWELPSDHVPVLAEFEA
jgi:exodeoxyribonuclease III